MGKPMIDTPSTEAALDRLRRAARHLARAHQQGDPEARARLRAASPRPDGTALKHADYLHVLAREQGFASWPALKAAYETRGMDRAQKLQRLKIAIHHGQVAVVERLLADTPDLADGALGVEIALYRRAAVAAALARDPEAAVRPLGVSPPLVQLCQSRMFRHWPHRQEDMMAIAEMLRAGGADLDLGPQAEPGSEHRLSPLYFALGHAGNLRLARWLLEHGASPNDNESLYHATELGHREGLRLLLEFGADPAGTNAVPRAMDFHDLAAVQMLLEAGANPNEGADGVPPVPGTFAGAVVPLLHQAARRHSDGPMIDLLLAAGADPAARWKGISAYTYAAVYGNAAMLSRLEAVGAAHPLDETQALLAAAARGEVPEGRYLNFDEVPEAFQNLPRELLYLPGRLPHLRALFAVGFPWDRPDAEGLTPVQVAGWEGLPEIMAYLLSLKPDLSHVNGFGGTLLSTIVHGSENCPARAERDHVACARLALEEGVALPRRAPDFAVDPDMAAFLADWAEAHPGQVVEHGVV